MSIKSIHELHIRSSYSSLNCAHGRCDDVSRASISAHDLLAKITQANTEVTQRVPMSNSNANN
jgi:hypothetical protein